MNSTPAALIEDEAPSLADAPREPAHGFLKGRASSISRGLMSLTDQAIVSGTTFITTVTIGRFCSKHELGLYYLAFSILLLLRGIQTQLVSTPYMIFWSRKPAGDQATFLGSSVVHQVVLTAIVAVGLAAHIVLLWRGDMGPPDLLPVISILLLGMPFLLLREFIRSLNMSHMRLLEAISVDATVAAVQIGLLLVLGHFQLLTIPRVYAVMGLGCFLGCLGWLMRPGQRIEFVRAKAISNWKQNWLFGKWALLSHLVAGSITAIVPWIVAGIRGEAETGMLAAASTLVGLSTAFLTGLGNLLGPSAALAFSRGGIDALVRVLIRFALVFAATLGTFCAVLTLFGNTLAVMLYGEAYTGIGGVITLMAITILLNALRMTAGIGLWSIEMPRANLFADIAALAVTVVVAVICVAKFGVLGAAIGMLCGAITGIVLGTATLLKSLATVRHREKLAIEPVHD